METKINNKDQSLTLMFANTFPKFDENPSTIFQELLLRDKNTM